MSDALGIILAGGSGTRLYPMTKTICKQLQPVYDKPMVYYPLATLISGGIKDILIISTPQDIHLFKNLFSDGSHLGIMIQYAVQDRPTGIPESFIIAEPYINGREVCLILGDNLFHGESDALRESLGSSIGSAKIFGYRVDDPRRYGVVSFNKHGRVQSIEEKPVKPKSNYAIPGLYIYPPDVVDVAKGLTPSSRGELEIVDIHRHYADSNKLDVKILPRGVCWFDAGTPDSLLEASQYIHAIEKRQGRKIGCVEEISWIVGNLSNENYAMLINDLPNSPYRDYIRRTLEYHNEQHS